MVSAVRWPAIGKPIAYEDLSKHLFYTASLHARRALAATKGDLDTLDRATSIGTSVELLAKSALALMNPALIADKDASSILLYSGVPATTPQKAKTRGAADCLGILRQSHHIDYNRERDAVVFDVRNLAAHMGFVDPADFEDALNALVALSEQILSVVVDFDASRDRILYWSGPLLVQVDERLKAQRQAQILQLEQLVAAARGELERLERRFDNDEIADLSDRPPDSYWAYTGGDHDDVFKRRKCPACEFDGWLEFSTSRSRIQYDYGDAGPGDLRSAEMYVEVAREAQEFHCTVCQLRIDNTLLALAGMAEEYTEWDEPTPEEISAEEEYAIDSYYESLHED